MLVEAPVLAVVAVALAGERDVQLVVEVVGPLRVEAPLLDRPVRADLLLGDQERVREPLSELGEHVLRGLVVEDREDGVQAEAVDPEVVHPQLRVLDRPLAHGPLREVDRAAPGGLVAVGDVGAEGGDRLRARAEVVVDDVEDHGEADAVRGVDEAGEAVRAAVGGVDGGEVEAVVAPAPVAGEGGDRHQLDRRARRVAARARQVRDRRRRRCPRR